MVTVIKLFAGLIFMMIPTSEKCLLDTNILVYCIDKTSIYHLPCQKIVKSVFEGSVKGVISIQNILEFYSVVTSPKSIPHPISNSDAINEINKLNSPYFEIIYPTIDTFKSIRNLLVQTKIKAEKVYDLYLVATMLSKHIYTLITVNEKDFLLYQAQIKIINPKSRGFEI